MDLWSEMWDPRAQNIQVVPGVETQKLGTGPRTLRMKRGRKILNPALGSGTQ